MTLACAGSTIAVLWLLVSTSHAPVSEALHILGWWPVHPLDIARALLLTAILFTGPLFERGVAEGEWRDWVRGRRVSETLGGWIGWRNYVAGPVSEEIMFRSVIIAVHLLARLGAGRTVFLVPVYFGIAHVHHFYEFRITHPETPLVWAVLRSVVQFSYTTVFGWYANFLFLRTGSLLAVIVVHTFCNWCGLPRLWGRVECGVPLVSAQKEDDVYVTPGGELGMGWTVAYYVLLVVGAVGFYYAMWPLTESENALVLFS